MSSKPSKSSKSKDKSKESMRAVDPRPIRSPSPTRGDSYPPPPPRSPGQSQSQPPPDQPRYNPQEYPAGANDGPTYGPQEYSTQQNYTTSQSYQSQSFGPQTSQPYNPQDFPPVSAATGPPPGPGVLATGLPLRPASDPQLPADKTKVAGNAPGYAPGGMTDVMRPGPATQIAPTVAPNTLRELKSLKTNCQFGLREFLSLQRQRKSGEPTMSSYELDMRLQDTAFMLLNDLRVLQGEVRGIAKEAESHRWRRWIIGGAM